MRLALLLLAVACARSPAAGEGPAYVPPAGCTAPARPGPRCAIGFPRSISTAAVTRDGGRALVGVSDAGVTVWRLPAGVLAGAFLMPPPHAEPGTPPHGDTAAGLAAGPDGTMALVALEERLLVYDLATGRPVRPLPPPGGLVRSVAWSPDGTRVLVAAHGTRDALVLDAADGRALARLAPASGDAASVAFAADGTRAAVGGDAGSIALLALDGRAAPLVLDAGTRAVETVAFAGDRLVAAAGDDVLRVWDAGGRLVVAARVPSPFRRLAVSPDGTQVATAGRDWAIRLHDLSGGAVRRTLAWHRGAVTGLAWGGTVLVSGDAEGHLALWDVAPATPEGPAR